MKQVAPQYLFKYKPLSSSDDLSSVLDVIVHNKIYIPTPKQLNDPMEGFGVVHTGSYAGCSIHVAMERQGKGLNKASEYRVLSLTELASSPQMWAHYGGGYTGACIRFNTASFPFEVVPVRYAARPIQILGDSACTVYDSEDISRGALTTKHVDWAYEQEWRGLFSEGEVDAEGYVSVGVGNPTAVILGENCSVPTVNFIRGVCKSRGIPVYSTYVANWIQRVRVIPFGLELGRAGIELRKQVADYCMEQGIDDLNVW
ncbi:MAG: DUF2971 domain-containing protein [Atopobiaceae bacterium]|nr:DUF2971 domain-containing protein [Atopobiaceae bacterium]